jgi:hypothetical protein
VSADEIETEPRESGATSAVRIDAYWYPSFGWFKVRSEKLPVYPGLAKNWERVAR